MELPPIDVDEEAVTNVLVVDFAPGVLKGDPRPDEASLKVVEGPDTRFARASQCRHLNIRVNEDLAEVVCRDCDAKLNPIWVLIRMGKEETKWAFRRTEYIKMREALAQRSRCKCQHCGQMTRIKV